ncbi:MAG TPA: hypothetical protein VJO54_12935 [Burkholderiales bacterium]|nr:hypothetical protein [Burkholderiales bacterium]
MPAKRLCYFTSQQVTVYRSHKGELLREGAFGTNEKGVGEFARYVADNPESLYFVLADVVEEDFYQENLPFVRGSDRSALLARKLAQRYRDASLAVPISLGSEVHAGRREERVLYTSFTNAQQFQPWLDVLRARKVRVAGVFSVALVAASLGKRLRFKASRYVIVSLQQAGLRQSYIENGRIRFSRIVRVNFADPHAIAQDCATESLRTLQYLVNSRILPREAQPLDVLVLAAGDQQELYEAACVDSPRLHFHVQAIDKVARNLGLKSLPAQTLGEALYLQVLAEAQPSPQFADDGLRHYYHLWRGRVALVTAGASILGLCALVAGSKFLDAYQVTQEVAADYVQETRASQEYARLQARFPKTPTSTENLRALVKNYRALLRQSASPGSMLAEISQAVTPLPQIEIDRIDWEVGGAKAQAASDAAKAQAPRQAALNPESGPEAPVQAAEISGRLVVPQASDYRAVTELVSQFTDALRARPGTEVVRTQLPFDINAEKSIAGDIGAARREEVPQFSVAITRRRGT